MHGDTPDGFGGINRLRFLWLWFAAPRGGARVIVTRAPPNAVPGGRVALAALDAWIERTNSLRAAMCSVMPTRGVRSVCWTCRSRRRFRT